ncbi:MAG: DUF3324 domain-containing protein [archaeon]
MNKIIKIIIFGILILLVTKSGLAIGISPSRVTVNFEPNLDSTYTYNIINRENPTTVQMYTKGELAGYVSLSETSTTLNENEIKSFVVEVNLPENIEKPGIYDTRIGVVEAIPENLGGVGAVTGVESQFLILVPYPGKYISTKLSIEKTNLNKETEITLDVQNLGTENLNNVDATIRITDSNGTEVAILTTNSIKINTKESGEISTKWTPTDLSAGEYIVKAKVYFDEESIETEKSFQIGDLLIEILKIVPTAFQVNTINKIEISLKSLWNEKITDVYAELQILDNNQEIGIIKTESIELKPLLEKNLNAYWDTTNVNVGDYILHTTLYFADKSMETNIPIQVKRNIFSWNLVIIGVLIIIIAIFVYRMLKRRKNES